MDLFFWEGPKFSAVITPAQKPKSTLPLFFQKGELNEITVKVTF